MNIYTNEKIHSHIEKTIVFKRAFIYIVLYIYTHTYVYCIYNLVYAIYGN